MQESSHDRIRRIATQVPQSEKRSYLAELSEDEFRDKVVRPLFKHLGYTDGRDTCGPQELGRDAYFTQESPLTGTEITVIQTKRGKITKSGKPSENLDTIVTQLRTAVDTPVLLLSSKQKRRPLRGMLIASGEIKPAAVQYIVDELRDPRVEFLDSERIIPLIDDTMPEFWLNIASELLPYFRAVCNLIEEGYDLLPGGLKLAIESTKSSTADDIFADVYVYRPPKTRIPTARKPKKGTIPKLAIIPITTVVDRPERLILLVGEGGSGKSTALKRILYEKAIRPGHSQSAMRIPIALRAKDIAATTNDSLLDHCAKAVTKIGATLKSPFNQDDLLAGRVIIMVDGLDEVTDHDKATHVLKVIDDYHSTYPHGQVLITSRESGFLRAAEFLKSFTEFRLSALVSSQVAKLVNGYSKKHALGAADSQEILRRLTEINGVDLSPLIVTIFVATSDSSRGDYPANITELFNKYTELMLGRWDESKGLHVQIQAPIKDFVLRQIAFRMHEKRETAIKLSEFKSILSDELARRGYSEAIETLYEEIIVRSGLFRLDEGLVEFKHLILQEYFAGKAIPDATYVGKVAGDVWWRSAVVFFFGANPGSIESLRHVAESLPRLDGGERLFATTTVGLALQACYLAELDSKEAIYRQVLGSLMNLRGEGPYDGLLDDYPLVKTNTMMYLVRDSLALSGLKFFHTQIFDDFGRFSDAKIRDDGFFWLIVALVEIGQFNTAHEYVERFKPNQPAYLFALLVQLIVVAATRVLDSNSLKEASAISLALATRLNATYPALSADLQKERTALAGLGRKSLPPAPPEADDDEITLDEG